MRSVKTRRAFSREIMSGLVLAGVLGRTVPGLAEGRSDPAAFVQAFADAVLAKLRDRSLGPEERLQAMNELAEKGFAFDRIARVTLGRHWRSMAEPERLEFGRLFKAAVVRSYGQRFDEYADHSLRVTGAATAGPDGGQMIVTSLVEGGRGAVRLDWRLTPAAGSWQVLDVVVEGVSLTLTYRNEFASVIERGGGDVTALLAELRLRAERAAG